MTAHEPAYERVRSAAGHWDESSRGRIRVSGRDATKFLQSMLTQDVRGLAPGVARDACALTVKAKLVAFMRVVVHADGFLVDVERERVVPLVEHLRRFIVVNQVVLEDATEALGAIAVEGPAARELLERAAAAAGPESASAQATISGETGYRLFGPRAAIERALVALGAATLTPPSVVELLRIENGTPRHGAELDEHILPPEAGLDRSAIDYAKGCFLGQEPIARLRFLGHLNRSLMGLALVDPAIPALPGDTRLYTSEGREVGRVTSSARSFRLGRVAALGYVRREANAPGTVLRAGAPGGAVTLPIEVRSLPLVAPTAPAAGAAVPMPGPAADAGAAGRVGGTAAATLLPRKPL